MMLMKKLISNHWFIGRIRAAVTGILLVVCVLMVIINWQYLNIFWNSPLWRQSNLPEFDVRNAAKLSSEHRAELERELFSEMHFWNNQSRRYSGANALNERKLRWIQMSSEGYELAHLVLQVFEPGSPVHNPLPALKRLEELASRGDSGAMCLYVAIAYRLPSAMADWTSQKKIADELLARGVEFGHPQCLISKGARMMSDHSWDLESVKAGAGLVLAAINKGYTHGSLQMWTTSTYNDLNKKNNRQMEYCWGAIAGEVALISPGEASRIYASNSDELRPIVEKELLEFGRWNPSLLDCVKLTEDVIGGKR